MADESVNEHRDLAKMSFLLLEEEVTDIKHDVNVLMAYLRNKLEIFGEDGGSNVEEKSEGGSGDQDDTENQPKKELRKYQPSSSVVNQFLFKMEEKVMQEHLVDRVKTEKGRKKFLKKIGEDEQFDKWTASLSEFLHFYLISSKVNYNIQIMLVNFYLFYFTVATGVNYSCQNQINTNKQCKQQPLWDQRDKVNKRIDR